MLKEDTALELDVMNKIRFMILWKKDEILAQLVRHMKKRQRFLAQERGENSAFIRTKHCLRRALDDLELSDLSEVAQTLLADYFSENWTTTEEREDSFKSLEEVEEIMDIVFGCLHLVRLGETVQRIVWDFMIENAESFP